MSRYLRRARPASSAATIAVFLALGGVAYAVTGSGTLQKENEIGVGTGTEVIRTVAGVGDIRASCVDGPHVLGVFVQNGSDETLKLGLDRGNTLLAEDSLSPGGFTGATPITADEILQFHVFPADGSKTPQADITVSVDYTGSCATTGVSVLSVSTTASGSGTVAGSGTVQKGADIGFTSGFGDNIVRTITGLGRIEVQCITAPVVRLANTSGEAIRVFTDQTFTSSAEFDQDSLDDGDSTEADGHATEDAMIRYHAFPADGSKRPQADITVSIDNTGSCATGHVSVLSVSTEQ